MKCLGQIIIQGKHTNSIYGSRFPQKEILKGVFVERRFTNTPYFQSIVGLKHVIAIVLDNDE